MYTYICTPTNLVQININSTCDHECVLLYIVLQRTRVATTPHELITEVVRSRYRSKHAPLLTSRRCCPQREGSAYAHSLCRDALGSLQGAFSLAGNPMPCPFFRRADPSRESRQAAEHRGSGQPLRNVSWVSKQISTMSIRLFASKLAL